MQYYEEEDRYIYDEDGYAIGSMQLALYYEGYEDHFDQENFEYEEIEDSDNARVDFCYLMNIGIDEKYRNQGRGEKVLKDLAEEFGTVYLRPSNPKCKHLYRRICDEMRYLSIPEVIRCEADNACPYDDDGEREEDFSGMFRIYG